MSDCKEQKISHEGHVHNGGEYGNEAPSQGNYPEGIKWTRQRKRVYDILKECHEPLNAVQIYQLVEKDLEETYAISTIYRILAAFEEKKLVTKSSFMDDGQMVYELNRGEHTHYAVCLECHKRIPLESCPFAHLHMEGENGDFLITGHKLELYGYCKECKHTR